MPSEEESVHRVPPVQSDVTVFAFSLMFSLKFGAPSSLIAEERAEEEEEEASTCGDSGAMEERPCAPDDLSRVWTRRQGPR